MKYFCVPADFRKETIDEYEKLNRSYRDSRVVETYGNITIGNTMESGRPVDMLPAVDFKTLENYVKYSRDKGIDFSYTMNAPYMEKNKQFTKEGITAIHRFLERLHQAGVSSITAALPSLMDIINSGQYDYIIKASTICNVTNANKAELLLKKGAARIVADESINRDFNRLQDIVRVSRGNVEIIVNSICFIDCVNRMFHYNQIAGDSVENASGCSNQYFPHRCLLRRFENIGNLLRLSWIRPEDLHYYKRIGIKYFKLQGRPRVLTGDPVRAVTCYFQEEYNGDLMELLNLFAPVSSFDVPLDNGKLQGFLQPYYKVENFCKNQCSHCGYCETFARKILNYQQVEKVFNLAKNFYNQYDHFNQILDSRENGSTKLSLENTRQHDSEFTFDL